MLTAVCPGLDRNLRDGAVAGLAVPDTNRVTLDSGLSAEGARVLGVLGDFHLLDGLSERGTVSLVKHVSSCLIPSPVLWPRRAVMRCVRDLATNSQLLIETAGSSSPLALLRIESPARVFLASGRVDRYHRERGESGSYLVPYLPVTVISNVSVPALQWFCSNTQRGVGAIVVEHCSNERW